MSRICLICPHHVSFQPRTLREADSLHAAGHEVRVVSRYSDSMRTERDRELMSTRQWRLDALDLRRNGPNHRGWLVESAQAKLAQGVFRAGIRNANIAVRASVKGFSDLVKLATREPADWFVAHTQLALPIAAAAARQFNAHLGFDCEDLLGAGTSDPEDLIRPIERRYLAACDYVSVASEGMADELVRRYGVARPIILYNAFPLEIASGMTPPAERRINATLRLHWFGQTIGLGRGIEDAIRATGMLGGRVELYLRGRIDAEFRRRIERLAGESGLAGELRFLPVIDHHDLVRSMEQFDVGLALERPENSNYSVTVTNKVFSYMLAGLAVAATDTKGHREVLTAAPNAGSLYPAGNTEALAVVLRTWINDRKMLRAAQQAAWDMARARFCWDHEQTKLFQALDSFGDRTVTCTLKTVAR